MVTPDQNRTVGSGQCD